jgi:hypothetical protein
MQQQHSKFYNIRLHTFYDCFDTDVSFKVLSEAFSSDTDSPPVTPKMQRRGSVNYDPSASENLLESGTTVHIVSKKSPKLSKHQKSDIPTYVGPGGEPLPASIFNNITRFLRKQPKGLIDVWWLYDDGGTLPQVASWILLICAYVHSITSIQCFFF